ncbi:MAG: helix-turn-helix transcriptional regulator [Clostridia bacterium]|nr:helix-turn-helix transcriptional regulator [Clostridia bacterium]
MLDQEIFINLSNNLFDLRKKHGYSQAEMADALGISSTLYAKMERADNCEWIPCFALLKIHFVFGVSIDSLFESPNQ